MEGFEKMVVYGVSFDANRQPIVLLRVEEGTRFLPIWIGMYEAEAITIALQAIEIARPQTHDLMTTLISALHGNLIRVEITQLKDDVFYASLVIEQNGKNIVVDCRPSDAIALAARTGVDILVDEEVMEQAAIRPGEDDDEEGGDLDGGGLLPAGLGLGAECYGSSPSIRAGCVPVSGTNITPPRLRASSSPSSLVNCHSD